MKGLIFSSEMVNAIREGRKTVTRRVIKVQPPTDQHRLLTTRSATAFTSLWYSKPQSWAVVDDQLRVSDRSEPFCVPHKGGDTVYVKETWRLIGSAQMADGSMPWRVKPEMCVYKADADYDGPWKSPMFMPESAARIFLEIVSVRPERLHDITDDDAINEGCVGGQLGDFNYERGHALTWFSWKWEQMHSKKTPWESNPWVWRIEFRQTDAPK